MKNEDEEFYKKARYKTSQIHIILGIEKEEINKSYTVNKKSIRAFKFTKRDIIGNIEDFIYPVIEDENNFF
jgi:hypothetical protein